MKIEKRWGDKEFLVNPVTGCWNWMLSCTRDGYGKVWLNKKCVAAHRASWLKHMGGIPDDLCVLHRCDNKLCVNPEHLFLGTKQDNMIDMLLKGRHGRRKLTKEDVIKIRSMRDSPTSEIARIFDIDMLRAWRVRTGKSWSFLGES